MPGAVGLAAAAAAAAAVAGLLLGAVAWRPELPVRWARSVLAGVFWVSLAAALVLVEPVGSPDSATALDAPGAPVAPDARGGPARATAGRAAPAAGLDGDAPPAFPLRLRLRLDASTDPLLPRRDPGRAAYERAVLDFGDDELYVIAARCGDVFTEACLRGVRSVAGRLARLSGVRSVGTLLDATSFRYVPDEDWVEVRPLVEEIPARPAALAALRERVLSDPLYRRTLVSEDGRATGLDVGFREMSDEAFMASGLDGRVTGLLEEASDGADGLGFHVAGRPHAKVRIHRGMVRDVTVLIPLAVLVAAVALWAATGRVRGVVLPLGTGLAAVGWTFAAVVLVGRPLTVLSGLLGPTLLALGCVYAVHVLARFEEEVAEGAPDAVSAAALALRHLRAPILIAGPTTVAGFAALLLSDVPAVHEVGAFAVIGVSSIAVLSLWALPAALALLPARPGARGGAGAGPRGQGLDRALAGLARQVARRPSTVLAVAAVLVGSAAASVPHIVVDTDYLSYLDRDDPVRRDFDAVNRLLAGAVPLYVVVEGPEAGAFRDPAALRALDDLQQRVDALPGVSRSVSFVETLKALNRAFGGGDPAQARVPETRAGVAELLFMVPKSDLRRFATVDHRRANLVVRTGEVGSRALQELAARLRAEAERTDWPPGFSTQVTGNSLLLARSADGIARGQPATVGLAALAILALVSAGLGSLRLGLLAMVPNVVPVLLFYGLLGAGAAPLSLATGLIGSVALGIAVDDTAHLLARYRGERARGLPPEAAVVETCRRVGRPVVLTSGVLCLGFGVVAFSDFAPLREFGVLTAATMGICLATDLLLLPALLLRTRL